MFTGTHASVLPLQFSNLAKLQAEVNGESIKHAHLLEERDEMLQRVSNNDPRTLFLYTAVATVSSYRWNSVFIVHVVM